jgi:hypothetical protein
MRWLISLVGGSIILGGSYHYISAVSRAPQFVRVTTASEEQRTEQERRPYCVPILTNSAARIVLVYAGEGHAISTSSLGSEETEVRTSIIDIEPGEQPLIILASSGRAIIWQIRGAVGRVDQFIGTSSHVAQSLVPLVGVVGVPKERVALLKRQCTPSYGYSEAFPKSASRILNRPVETVFHGHRFASISLPSGKIDEEGKMPAELALPVFGRGVSLWRDLLRKVPGGIAEVSAAAVVSNHPAKSYRILPGEAGLIQLLNTGALQEIRGGGGFLIVKPTDVPAWTHGERLVLADNVPPPNGEANRSRIVRQSTARPILTSENERHDVANFMARCALPKIPPGVRIVSLGVGYGAAVTTLSLGRSDAETRTGIIEIESGTEPLAILAVSQTPMIWQVKGSTDRVRLFMASSGRVDANKAPLTGVIGIPKNRVVFPPDNCLHPFHDRHDASGIYASGRLATLIGNAPDHVLGYEKMDTIALPSGSSQATSRKKGSIISEGLSILASTNEDMVTAFLEPSAVVSPLAVRTGSNLPGLAGLKHLIQTGALVVTGRTRARYFAGGTFAYGDVQFAPEHSAPIKDYFFPSRFKILRAMHMPSDIASYWKFTFVLPEGVPMPDGQFGNIRIVSEATGKLLHGH